jgi:hypothetical protein
MEEGDETISSSSQSSLTSDSNQNTSYISSNTEKPNKEMRTNEDGISESSESSLNSTTQYPTESNQGNYPYGNSQ